MNHLQQTLNALCEAFGIQILYAFGSRAKEMQQFIMEEIAALSPAQSDGDIGVKPAKSMTIQQKVKLTQELEALFDLPRIDLVVLPEADPFLAANIIRGERLYASDLYLADEYDLYILRRAGDLAPLERERQQIILHKLRS
ncbi:MAG: nucleotidyltransferase domain-containing protein [Ardenticatenaceae bacterium]|nr:nucleotidyltransferase domain-containing protein [Ardenticatenaceae bacterium]